MQRKEKMEGGRYSILNKDFEPLHIDIPDTKVKKAVIDWEPFDKLKEFSYKQFSWQKSSSSDGSTDSLLEEASNFLEIAKERFVTNEDWVQIKSKKKSSTSQMSVRDLEINDQVQFIGQDLKIVQGQIRNIVFEDLLLHVAV